LRAMSDRWVLDTLLAGRRVLFAGVGAGGTLAAPGPCSVVALLSGDAAVGGRALVAGECVVAPGSEIVAGRAGCTLGAVSWDAAPPGGAASIESTASRHFEKYQSFQAQLRVRDRGRDLLAPWELYRVRMVAEVRSTVQMHVHHVVTNLLFIAGEPGTERGYLVVARDGRVTATPLVGGDRAIVPPGLHHHVIPLDAGDPTDMIVFNDRVSAYEDTDHSDFHLVETVPWGDVERTPRPAPGPCLTVVG